MKARQWIGVVLANVSLVAGIVWLGVAAIIYDDVKGLLTNAVFPVLMALAAAEIVRSIGTRRYERKVSEIHGLTTSLHGSADARDVRDRETNRMVKSLYKESVCGVHIENCPHERDEYIDMWSDFVDEYRAYNPCYRLERGGPGIREAAIEVFVRRYSDPAFKKAFYLFLTKDDEGRDDLAAFRKLIAEVVNRCPHVEGKVEVRERKDLEAVRDCEIYRGTKQGRKVSIIEPLEPALRTKRGRPSFYIVVSDARINEELAAHFQNQWESADEVRLFAHAQAGNIPAPLTAMPPIAAEIERPPRA
jgi:hypothetical protein